MRVPYIIVLATGLGLALGGCTESSSSMGSDESGSTTSGETNTLTSESTTDASAEVSTTTDAASTDASESTDTDATDSSDATGTDPGPCEYPEGAVEPMALNEVLWPYSWAAAKRADGLTTPLDLTKAHCDTDEVIDWSPHDVLVFVSIPAW